MSANVHNLFKGAIADNGSGGPLKGHPVYVFKQRNLAIYVQPFSVSTYHQALVSLKMKTLKI